MRVLIVDDNRTFAEALGELFRSRGVSPTISFDGRDAIREVQLNDFEIALVDLRLPNVSGSEVIKALVSKGTCPQIFLMTGSNDPEVERARIEAGVENVLRKPFSPSSLFEQLGLTELNSGSSGMAGRIAHFGPEGALELPEDLGVVRVDDFSDEMELRRALAMGDYDAAVLALDRATPTLLESLKSLDGELAVVSSGDPELVLAGMRRGAGRRALKRELVTQQRVFERLKLAMLIVAGDPAHICSWNSALLTLLNHSPGRLGGAMLSTLDGRVEVGQLDTLVHDALRGRSSVERLVQVRIGGGRVRAFVVSALALGIDARVCLTLVPEAKASSEALAMVGATAAGVAHEMRNTLAGVTSSLAVLRGRAAPDSDEERVITQVLDRMGRAAEVMNDLLMFARPSRPQLRAIPARLLLSSVVDEVVGEVTTECLVQFECTDPTLVVVVDPGLMQMALVNLTINAVQAVDGPGEVVLSVAIVGDQVEFRVEDSGPGIPTESREDIFTPFFTTRAQGSGLGLANVRQVMEQHGGLVDLLAGSTRTTFVCRLPRKPTLEEEA